MVGTKCMMKTFVRVFTLVLACLMCVAPIVACDSGNGGNKGDNSGMNTNAAYDENGLIWDDLASNNPNYLGEEINILHWNDSGYPEFVSDEITGDNVQDSVFKRNSAIEERLNVSLNFIGVQGANAKRASFVQRVDASRLGQSHDIDIVSSYSRTQGMLAVAGLLYNLNDMGLTDEQNHLNLNQPWWPADLQTTLSFGGSCYFLSGDISNAVLYNMTCVFFNKDRLNARFNEDAQAQGFDTAVDMLYDMVYLDSQNKTSDKQWTIDSMITLANDFCKGVTNEDKVENNTYGFVSVYYQLDGFYTGSNLRLVEKDDAAVLKISNDFGSTKTVALVKQLGDWVTSSTCLVESSNGQLGLDKNDYDVPGHMIPFMKNKALFTMCRSEMAGSKFAQQKGLSYGILPVPKYDAKQVNYYTCLGNPISIFGIFIDCVDPADGEVEAEKLSMLTAVLEVWASEGYRKCMPEIFYVNMMVKYSETEKESHMFQYVRNGIIFDLGRIFSDDLSYMSEMPSRAAATGSSWVSSHNQYRRSLDKKIADMVESFNEQGVF